MKGGRVIFFYTFVSFFNLTGCEILFEALLPESQVVHVQNLGEEHPVAQDYMIITNGEIILSGNALVEKYFIFSGNCTINGVNNKLIFGSSAKFFVTNNSSLKLENVTVEGVCKKEEGDVTSSNLYCVDITSNILCQNVVLRLIDDYIFKFGKIIVCADSYLRLENVTGREFVNFSWQNSSQLSFVHNSKLMIDEQVRFIYLQD